MHVFREVPLTVGSNYSNLWVLWRPTVTSAVISPLICGASVQLTPTLLFSRISSVRFGQTQQVSTKLDISIVGTRHSSLASPLHSRSLLSRSHTCRDTCEQALACVMIFFSFFCRVCGCLSEQGDKLCLTEGCRQREWGTINIRIGDSDIRELDFLLHLNCESIV